MKIPFYLAVYINTKVQKRSRKHGSDKVATLVGTCSAAQQHMTSFLYTYYKIETAEKKWAK